MTKLDQLADKKKAITEVREEWSRISFLFCAAKQFLYQGKKNKGIGVERKDLSESKEWG